MTTMSKRVKEEALGRITEHLGNVAEYTRELEMENQFLRQRIKAHEQWGKLWFLRKLFTAKFPKKIPTL